jgi:hypothetical protein
MICRRALAAGRSGLRRGLPHSIMPTIADKFKPAVFLQFHAAGNTVRADGSNARNTTWIIWRHKRGPPAALMLGMTWIGTAPEFFVSCGDAAHLSASFSPPSNGRLEDFCGSAAAWWSDPLYSQRFWPCRTSTQERQCARCGHRLRVHRAFADQHCVFGTFGTIERAAMNPRPCHWLRTSGSSVAQSIKSSERLEAFARAIERGRPSARDGHRRL